MANESKTSDRYCIGCEQSLRGLSGQTCPECGRQFDLGDDRTTLPHPYGEFVKFTAALGRPFVWSSIVVTILACALTAAGFDRLQGHIVAGAFVLGGIVVTCAAFAIEKPYSYRLLVATILAPVLLLTIELTHWPAAVSVMLCTSCMDRVAESAQNSSLVARRGVPHTLRVRRGRLLPNGNYGIQLIGGDGGGLYLVKRKSGLHLPDGRVWYNTNWEKDLGEDWYLVYED